MEKFKKVLFGLVISASVVACSKSADPQIDTAQTDFETLEIQRADIPPGFENARVCRDLDPINGTDPRGAILRPTKWPNGSVITVRLYGGTEKVRARVREYASEWSQYANITFRFVQSGTAQIRVTFVEGAGSYSALGTAALSRLPNQETMNFGWFNDRTSEAELRATTLHEFGHVLGMIHEQQHPEAAIPWNVEAAYAYFGGPPNGWSKAQVDVNIFQRYATSQTQFSAYDPRSIMHYPISSELTTNGFWVGWNNQLSETDKQFIAQAYPKN
ncbi:matrixin family metalloprotease [Sphingobacterium deserti]|uniref:Peptidase M12A astacin n=1 Tax=Sphingobacterium deserti TaxID=1229276 RepID=A0A0B8T1V5_9SPHI|nr:matrixin family metalloprotease [Sphingobacterium deserti]KGE12688.1 peptidase M12A astacin [Sphingobacterium deserti]